MKKIRVDLVGQKFGKLVVIGFNGIMNGASYRDCECECGNKKTIQGRHLKNGKTKSCGCLYKISSSAFKNTHGGTGTKLYGIRRGMLQRCNDKKAINYKNYGGRGITILWESFIEFRDDMEEAYKEGLTIERINNDGNYCKENCCWIPHREQQQNKRKK